MHQDPVVIVSAARTHGRVPGRFSDLAAHDLGGAAIKAAVERAGIRPELVEKCCSATA
jgi:acetyl-CoA C-acetyltransferase